MDWMALFLAVAYVAVGTFVAAVMDVRDGSLVFLWIFWPVVVLITALIVVVLCVPYMVGDWVRDKFL